MCVYTKGVGITDPTIARQSTDEWCSDPEYETGLASDNPCLSDSCGCDESSFDIDLAEFQETLPECCLPFAADIGFNPSQRANVVDNMVAAAANLGLSNDALFLGVACLDRYLAIVPTSANLLQPLSVACLWVAAKYDTAVVPRAALFASFMADMNGQSLGAAASSVDLLVMLEAGILKCLNYRLASITTTKCSKHEIIQNVQNSMATAEKLSLQQRQLLYSMTSYLTEVSLLEYQLLPCPPSELAAASYALSHVLLGLHLDCKQLPEVTGYTFPQLRITLQYLCALHTTLSQALENGKPYAVTVKYCSPVVQGVARVAPLLEGTDVRLAA